MYLALIIVSTIILGFLQIGVAFSLANAADIDAGFFYGIIMALPTVMFALAFMHVDNRLRKIEQK